MNLLTRPVALFALRIARAANPLVDGRLFTVRAFAGASVVALAFSIAFGAMLLSIVLWCQDVWGGRRWPPGSPSRRGR